jgi:hypothetical protein
MKKIKFPDLVIVTSMLILVACNSGSKENRKVKNESVTTVIKNDSSSSTILTTAPLATPYSVANLPAGIKEFILKNYAGYAVVSAAPDPLCEGGAAIDVAVTKKGVPDLSLIFKPDGSFVQQEEDVPLPTASDKIRTVLKTKYAGYSAGSQIEKLTLVDKTVEYMVDLNKDSVTKEVIFSLDGNIVCEK